ncbi:hypothetical protein LOK49_LG08G00182 [Camellia lanceoleosa]|uniref:Uncharacterized protein n=1 Tax=Camellia lanceoleosa TaxID=1840588 RepID=A0ACC0GXV9_9ERIC|nr:hypothetical protein LOK49_LG08G00182 [Camellia lanceoleosa]
MGGVPPFVGAAAAGFFSPPWDLVAAKRRVKREISGLSLSVSLYVGPSSPSLCVPSPPLPQHLEDPNNNPSSATDSPFYSSVFLSLPSPKPISNSSISQLFFNSLALSAWKTTGFSTWSLRVNPSSGNLHPTEAYLISPPIDSVSNSHFVAHYAPKEHSLEIRTHISFGFFPKFFPQVSMAAAGLGWDMKILDGLGYGDLEKLMGLEFFLEFKIPSRPVKGKLPEIEFGHPDCVLVVFPNGVGEFDVNYKELSLAILEFSKSEWKGKPNLPSKEHVC